MFVTKSEVNFNTVIENFLGPEEFKDKKSVKKIIDFLNTNDQEIVEAGKSDGELKLNLVKLSRRFVDETTKYGSKNTHPMETLLWLSCMHPFFSAEERIALAVRSPALKILDLNGTDLNDEQLKFVAATFPHLETLNIRKCNNLTLDGYKHLQSFQQLKSLYVSESQNFDNEALQYLPQSLEKLWTRNNGANISIEGMEALSKLENLNTLIIRGCQITDDCLGHLCGLKKLILLDLHRCREITDKALFVIAAFETIEVLNFRDCKNITEEGFTALLSLKHLKKITIQGCIPMSEGLQEEFKKRGVELLTKE